MNQKVNPIIIKNYLVYDRILKNIILYILTSMFNYKSLFFILKVILFIFTNLNNFCQKIIFFYINNIKYSFKIYKIHSLLLKNIGIHRNKINFLYINLIFIHFSKKIISKILHVHRLEFLSRNCYT